MTSMCLADTRPRAGGHVRPGITLLEVVVVAFVLGVLLLATIFALPRRREVARIAGCRRNLAQIGIALVLYDQSEKSLPTIPKLAANPPPSGGPLLALLDVLSLPDLTPLSSEMKPLDPRTKQTLVAKPVPGFVCPSDRFPADLGVFPAPISYRATAGDQTDGGNGGFAPGRILRLSDIEAGDGLGYTAAFSERLLGSGRNQQIARENYMTTPAAIDDRGCPAAPPARWRGDAGRSWAETSWRSTLYNHAATPSASPSCLSEDGLTAIMSPSSGHVAGANVLMFDGSVRTVSPSIEPNIWKLMATTDSTASRTPAGPTNP